MSVLYERKESSCSFTVKGSVADASLCNSVVLAEVCNERAARGCNVPTKTVVTLELSSFPYLQHMITYDPP